MTASTLAAVALAASLVRTGEPAPLAPSPTLAPPITVEGRSLAVSDTSGNGHEFVVQPSAPTKIDRVVIMEDIAQGERVRKYTLEARVDGEWKPLAEGTTIGHKRIERVPPVVAQAVRMRVLESVGTPCIRRFAVFATTP
jgi:hypothetical protein